jgi:hypothetical protein
VAPTTACRPGPPPPPPPPPHPLLATLVFGALVLLTVILPACLDLQKVDPGGRVIDNFEDGGLPTWNRFAAWQCHTFVRDAGQDAAHGGQDGGQPADADGDPGGACQLNPETPGADDLRALRADFQLSDPPDQSRQFPGMEVVARTTSGTVDFTGFAGFVFHAYLDSAPASQSPLPTGTQFLVQLGCSTVKDNPAASQMVGIAVAPGASWTTFPLMLDAFLLTATESTHNQGCLRLVDSIHFTIHPGLLDGASTAGTLHLDNISLQN